MANNDQNRGAEPAQRAGAPAGNAYRGGLPPSRAEGDKTEMVRAEIMKTWSKLSDEDVRLYERQPNLFFERVKEKHGVSREVAQKRLDEITLSSEKGSTGADA